MILYIRTPHTKLNFYFKILKRREREREREKEFLYCTALKFYSTLFKEKKFFNIRIEKNIIYFQ